MFSIFDIERMSIEELSNILHHNNISKHNINQYRLSCAITLKDQHKLLDCPLHQHYDYVSNLLMLTNDELEQYFLMKISSFYKINFEFDKSERLALIYILYTFELCYEHISSSNGVRRHHKNPTFYYDESYKSYISGLTNDVLTYTLKNFSHI